MAARQHQHNHHQPTPDATVRSALPMVVLLVAPANGREIHCCVDGSIRHRTRHESCTFLVRLRPNSHSYTPKDSNSNNRKQLIHPENATRNARTQAKRVARNNNYNRTKKNPCPISNPTQKNPISIGIIKGKDFRRIRCSVSCCGHTTVSTDGIFGGICFYCCCFAFDVLFRVALLSRFHHPAKCGKDSVLVYAFSSQRATNFAHKLMHCVCVWGE